MMHVIFKRKFLCNSEAEERRFNQTPHNTYMHLTGYSRLRLLPLAGDAKR